MKSPWDRHCSVFCLQSYKDARIPQGMVGTLKGRCGEALVDRPQHADEVLLSSCHWPTHCTELHLVLGLWGTGLQDPLPFLPRRSRPGILMSPGKPTPILRVRRAAACWADLSLSWDTPAGRVQQGMRLCGVAVGRLAWSWVLEGCCHAAY